jgi:hypothetical protein
MVHPSIQTVDNCYSQNSVSNYQGPGGYNQNSIGEISGGGNTKSSHDNNGTHSNQKDMKAHKKFVRMRMD